MNRQRFLKEHSIPTLFDSGFLDCPKTLTSDANVATYINPMVVAHESWVYLAIVFRYEIQCVPSVPDVIHERDHSRYSSQETHPCILTFDSVKQVKAQVLPSAVGLASILCGCPGSSDQPLSLFVKSPRLRNHTITFNPLAAIHVKQPLQGYF